MMDAQTGLQSNPLEGIKSLIKYEQWGDKINLLSDGCTRVYPLDEALHGHDVEGMKDVLVQLAMENALPNYNPETSTLVVKGAIENFLIGFIGGVRAVLDKRQLADATGYENRILDDSGKNGAVLSYFLTNLLDVNTSPHNLKSEIEKSGADVAKVVSDCGRLLSKLPRDPDGNSVFDFARQKLSYMKPISKCN